MKLILHIGVSKTGTTAIQKWLIENHAAHSKQICYPSDALLPETFQGNHRLLPLLSGAERVWETDFALTLLKRIDSRLSPCDQQAITEIIQRHLKACIDEACASGCNTLLLSNEHLSDRLSTQDIYRFSERISPLFTERKLIVYLRRQDAALFSLYAESLKHGNTRKFRDFAVHNPVAKLTFDYKRIIQAWSACGWQIIPRLYYEEGSSPPAWSLLNDFVSLLDYRLPASNLDAKNYSLNRSPDADSFEILRRLNYLRGKVPGSIFSFLKRQVLRIKFHPQAEEIIHKAVFKKIIEQYASDNAWIAEKYFSRDELFRLTI